MFHFKQDKLQANTLLGKGYTSTVHPYQTTPQDTRWAVKILQADSFPKLLSIYQNIASIININHPNILPVHGLHAEEQKHNGYMVYVKLPRMQSDITSIMEDHIQRKTSFNEESLVSYLHDILNGLSWLYSRKKIHGNIKPSNILLDGQKKIILADVDVTSFGSSHTVAGYCEDRDFYLSSEAALYD